MKNKFIDVEAQEDSDEEFEDVEENEAKDGQSISKRPRNEVFEDKRFQPCLGAVVDTLTRKYIREEVHSLEENAGMAISVDPRIEGNAIRIIRPDDWTLWRVKCTPGDECDVLCSLLSKHHFLDKQLRSAFVHPHRPGTLYLEARFLQRDNVSSLYHVLATLSSVWIQTLRAVPRNESEYWSCFEIRDDPHNDKGARIPGEWVTIKRGLYRGDVGVVLSSFERWSGMQGSEVALVPRLLETEPDDESEGEEKKLYVTPSAHQPSRTTQAKGNDIPASSILPVKHKRSSSQLRPQPQLFDVRKCLQSLLRKTTKGYSYDRFNFEHGLIIKTYHLTSLERALTIPNVLQPLLRQSLHPQVRHAPMPLPVEWHFEPGETVWVSPPDRDDVLLAKILQAEAGRGLFSVDTDEGHQVYSPFFISKNIKPGDFVEVVGGENAGKSGFVVSRYETLLYIAPGRFGIEPEFRAHVNSVRVATPSVAPVVIEPWIDLEVLIQSGAYASFKAVVKHVTPDGRGSLRLAIYVPKIFQTLEVDLFTVTEAQTGLLLFEYQPIQQHQKQFQVMPKLKHMRMGPVPWKGLPVTVVAGDYKGQTGTIRSVDRYSPKPQLPKRVSGLTLTVERHVMGPLSTNPLTKIDYDNVRFAGRKLADVCPPSASQSLHYLPLTIDRSARVKTVSGSERVEAIDSSDCQSPLPLDSDTATPMPTEFERAHIFTGVWSPGSHTPVVGDWTSPPWDPEPISSPSPSSTVCSSSSTGQDVNASSSSTHWILHANLVGIAIRVDIRGGPYDTTGQDRGVFVKTVIESGKITPMVTSRRGQRCPVSADYILKYRERPKPTSERSLMVVIEGPHVGKYVRQLYHYFQGEAGKENAKFIAMVMNRSASQEELTSEILYLDRDEVELAEETASERKYINAAMRDVRSSWRASRPEIRTL